VLARVFDLAEVYGSARNRPLQKACRLPFRLLCLFNLVHTMVHGKSVRTTRPERKSSNLTHMPNQWVRPPSKKLVKLPLQFLDKELAGLWIWFWIAAEDRDRTL
jgi:hypothetical protein